MDKYLVDEARGIFRVITATAVRFNAAGEIERVPGAPVTTRPMTEADMLRYETIQAQRTGRPTTQDVETMPGQWRA